MTRRIASVGVALLGLAVSASWANTDFTVRGTGDDAVDLPHRLTAGTWLYTVTYQTDDDDAPSFYLRFVGLTCDGSSIEELSASGRNKRLSVGAFPAQICEGWHEIDPIDFQLQSWSIRFVKEGRTTTRTSHAPIPHRAPNARTARSAKSAGAAPSGRSATGHCRAASSPSHSAA